MRKTFFATMLASTIAVGIAVPAAARPVTISIDLAGLDLNEAEAMGTARARIDKAVEHACTIRIGTFASPIVSKMDDDCAAEGRRKALAKLEAMAASSG